MPLDEFQDLAPDISIHALLAESDLIFCRCNRRLHYFYPRSPCGERLALRCSPAKVSVISIHALLAESDSARPETRQRDAISIHALLAESDRPKRYPAPACMYFYPRSPCGERLLYPLETLVILTFLSTLSLRRATFGKINARGRIEIFLSTLSLRRAT